MKKPVIITLLVIVVVIVCAADTERVNTIWQTSSGSQRAIIYNTTGNVETTGTLRLGNQSSNPTSLTLLSGSGLEYWKSGKRVMAYNASGTIVFTSINMASAGNVWTTTTLTAP